MAKYYLKTNPFSALKMLPMALKLLTHGRMPLRGETVKGKEQIKAMMDKANALGGAK